MTALAIPVPTRSVATESEPPLYRITVEQYHEMLRAGILKDGDPVELIEGVLVQKMGKKPPHRFATQTLGDLLARLLPVGWFADNQEPVTTSDSEPEPDLAIFRGDRRSFAQQDRHPGPEDTAIVIEVSYTTLAYDSGAKKRVYARAAIPEYWIVNVVERRIEVYTEPTGPCDAPTYSRRQDFAPGSEVPVRLDGHEAGRIAVNDLLV
ncbi:MAG: Uma2 family endonuclease [Gemmataceae bacterium]